VATPPLEVWPSDQSSKEAQKDLQLLGKEIRHHGGLTGNRAGSPLVLTQEGCDVVLLSRNSQQLNDLAETVRLSEEFEIRKDRGMDLLPP
jgi:hypothetical protein